MHFTLYYYSTSLWNCLLFVVWQLSSGKCRVSLSHTRVGLKYPSAQANYYYDTTSPLYAQTCFTKVLNWVSCSLKLNKLLARISITKTLHICQTFAKKWRPLFQKGAIFQNAFVTKKSLGTQFLYIWWYPKRLGAPETHLLACYSSKCKLLFLVCKLQHQYIILTF